MDGAALLTFAVIHRAGGVSAAATELHLSQPAVSRRLAGLEKQLGGPLFDRTPTGMVLTAAGEVLLPFAETAVANLRDAQAAVHAVHAAAAGPVRMALVGTLAGSALTPALRRFTRSHPGVQLHLRTATSHEVSDLVRRAEATIGLRYGTDPDTELHCEELFAERMVIVAANDHRLAHGRHDLTELGPQQWLAFPDVPGRPEAAARYVRRTLDAAGVADDRVLRVDSLTAQKRLVEAGFGIALIPQGAIAEEQATGSLAVVDVDGLDVAVPVTLLTRTRGYLSAAAQTLRAELRQLTTHNQRQPRDESLGAAGVGVGRC